MNEEQTKAARVVLDYLEENNSHTIGRLLYWDLFDGREDDLMYRAWLVAKGFIEDKEWNNR